MTIVPAALSVFIATGGKWVLSCNFVDRRVHQCKDPRPNSIAELSGSIGQRGQGG